MSELAMPNDLSLPFFAYGLLKPGDVAYPQISSYVGPEPVQDAVSGQLWARDGMPVFRPGEHDSVRGYVLTFASQEQIDAYEAICAFEPWYHYKWEIVKTQQNGAPANVLVDRNPRLGGMQLETGRWSTADDPMFNEGMSSIERVLENHAQEPFFCAVGTGWDGFFRTQMAYLMLWTMIERFATLRFGRRDRISKSIQQVAQLDSFRNALHRVLRRTAYVYSTHAPDCRYDLDPHKPVHSIKYYYAVRCNISHRGKAAHIEGEIVRESALELFEIFRDVLSALLPLTHRTSGRIVPPPKRRRHQRP